MKILRFGLRGLVVAGAIVLLVGIVGAGAATSGTSPVTNAKHFFWAAGQSSSASTTDQLQNDLIYHGGNVGPGAIGVEQKPAVYLIWWGQQWKSGFTTPDTDGTMYSSKTLQTYLAVVLPERGRQPVGERPDAVLRVRPGRLAELRRRWRIRHEPEGPAEGRLDGSVGSTGRHRHPRARPEPRRRSDRERGRPGRAALRLQPGRDVHHPHAAARRSGRARGRPTAPTTRRRRASTGSATRSGSSTRSSRG